MIALVLLAACGKVPIHPVEAAFTRADAAWFAAEETLFVFWEVHAEQGLGDPSVIEIRYATDDERVEWTPVDDLPAVHAHVPADCGSRAMCGSTSLHAPLEPREVEVRLRYHRDGALALDAETVFNVVGPGAPHASRSLVVYGVFDAENQRVQWRGRHQFPTVRNEEATRLGLRRWFSVADTRHGTGDLAPRHNPYAYGVDCPEGFVSTDLVAVETDERAVFQADPVPLGASAAAMVCGDATVTDAIGPFSTTAVARKNPEVRAAFPEVNTPIRDATPLRFFLAPCDRTISAEHEAMQRQRLLMGGVPTSCTDDWAQPGFVDELVVAFRAAVEAERPEGRDMVLVVGLHSDEAGLSAAVEDALVEVVPDEGDRASPRVAGAFVLDSTARRLQRTELALSTLWCPSVATGSDASARSCPTMPDFPGLDLGPFSFDTLPILPARVDYLEFIDAYSVAQAGEVTGLDFLTPELSTVADHVAIGDYGVVTFLDDEAIAADADDAFSYCTPEEAPPFVARSPTMEDPSVVEAVRAACIDGSVPESLCTVPDFGLITVDGLPIWHAAFGDPDYELGLYWDFPFLLRMDYRAVVAGSVTAFGLSVPFGLGSPAESYYGTGLWLQDRFSLDPALTQCRRFCDHPTFDSAGVYHVTDPFRETYAYACYVPDHPALGDGGFPRDP